MLARSLLDGSRSRARSCAVAIGLASLGAGCQGEASPPAAEDAAIIRRDADLDALTVRYVPPVEGYCRLPGDCDDRRTCTVDRCQPAHIGSFEGLCVHEEIPMCVEPPDAGRPDAGPGDRECDLGVRFSCASPDGCHEQVGWVVVEDAEGTELYEGCPLAGAVVLASAPLTGGAVVTVRYSDTEGPCPGSHRCDRAVFDVELIGQRCGRRRVLGTANLDNAADGLSRGPFRFTVEQASRAAVCCR